MDYELGEIILEREFDAVDKEGNPGKIQLRIGKPYLEAESEHFTKWVCPFQIIGIGWDKVKAMRGVDGIDALSNSLLLAEHYLEAERRYGAKITFMGDENLMLYPKLGEPIEGDRSNEPGFTGFEEIFEEFFSKFRAEHPRSPDADNDQ